MMTVDGTVTFPRMAHEYPLRTGLFSFGPLVLAIAQLLNGYVHDVSLVYPAGFAALLVAFAVLITRYHLATYRLASLGEVARRRR